MKRLLLTAASLIAAPLSAETIAITGGTVAIGDGSQPIGGGTVVIANGRIVSAGAGVAVPAGARVIDATGKWVSPGIVAGVSTLGLMEGYGMDEVNDTTASKSPFSAAIDVSTAINPTGQRVATERSSGITRAFVIPAAGNTMFGGQGAVIDLGADVDPVTKARAFQYVELGEDGASAGGGSRPAAYVLLKTALAAAANPASADFAHKDALITRQDAEALGPVVRGAMPLLVHVERAADIRAVLALKAQYPAIRLVLVGATEGWMIADQIAAARVPVIAAGLLDLPEKFETMAATQSNVGRLTRAGVTVAVSNADISEGPYESYLTQYAGNLVALTKLPGAQGLDWGQALASITSKPAAAIGMDREIGSLRSGRRADVVIWDGDPLELASAPTAIFIDGIAQPMTSRQTRLRDRYLDPVEKNLPKAYER
ncbi:amidohydrolase family protein [Rhizorhabdus dicambivorans]|uniref:Amidohydrolase n=1 Tax=Rhizorhabdus dicambivorans TaxID=1850238 RepID=A0A2A4G2E1_9SPHN|nr:amidohydrolase family protein [Rhizorhabdus dicambivorans]ATE64928.1 amidohydrolase [Rhizorhabdus dicambivorans]PCE44202.1 amidohydrolase [Rhizorhabdus dicambivorans]